MKWLWRVTALLVFMASLMSPTSQAQVMTTGTSSAVIPGSYPLLTVNLLGLRPDRVDPLRFDFILGLPSYTDPLVSIPKEAGRLTDYFLAALTIPQADLWVNLSPYEKDRIIPAAFGRTAMGRDLLEQDYQLKQYTAQLLSPQNETGRIFWDRIRELGVETGLESRDALDVFHKVWIVPDEATVYETASGVLIREARLRVMMEDDYRANRQNWVDQTVEVANVNPDGNGALSASAITLMKDLLLPVIEQEVNQGGRFEKLRQIYHAIILAAWYKEAFAGSVVNQQYSDQRKLTGIVSQSQTGPQEIYTEYLRLFKDGAGSMMEDYDPNVGDIVVRKYFSGGVNLTKPERLSSDFAMSSGEIVGLRVDLSVDSAMGDLSQSPETAFKREEKDFYEKAMLADIMDSLNRGDDLLVDKMAERAVYKQLVWYLGLGNKSVVEIGPGTNLSPAYGMVEGGVGEVLLVDRQFTSGLIDRIDKEITLQYGDAFNLEGIFSKKMSAVIFNLNIEQVAISQSIDQKEDNMVRVMIQALEILEEEGTIIFHSVRDDVPLIKNVLSRIGLSSPEILQGAGRTAFVLVRALKSIDDNIEAEDRQAVGGIDFNRSALRLNVHKEPGMEASARPSFSADFEIEGLTPGLMEMLTIDDVGLFLGS